MVELVSGAMPQTETEHAKPHDPTQGSGQERLNGVSDSRRSFFLGETAAN